MTAQCFLCRKDINAPDLFAIIINDKAVWIHKDCWVAMSDGSDIRQFTFNEWVEFAGREWMPVTIVGLGVVAKKHAPKSTSSFIDTASNIGASAIKGVNGSGKP